MKKKALVIGGTSGLGKRLALLLMNTHEVIVTGRHNPNEEGLIFENFEISYFNFNQRVEDLVSDLPDIDILIYAAGYYQEGNLTSLGEEDVYQMICVGLTGPIEILRKILLKQKSLSTLIAITSTSATTPRPLEPVYTAVKAGLSMLARSISKENGISKVLEVAPGGMNTGFWDGTNKNTANMLDPSWVAEVVLQQLDGEYSFRFVEILRNPSRISKIETIV